MLDLQVKPGDGDTQSDIEGWFASIAAPATSGEVTGHCVEQHCAVTIAVVNAKLTLTGPLADPPAARRATVSRTTMARICSRVRSPCRR